MAQYDTGTITTEIGTTVTGTGVDWTRITAGDRIFVNADVVSYEVATIDVPNSTLELTSNYPSVQTDVTYAIVQDYTNQLSLPLLNSGDQKTAEIYNRAMVLLDGATRGGLTYRGAYADADARDTAIPAPDDLDFVYLRDSDEFYVYTGAPSNLWELWDVAGVTVGPDGDDGLTPVADWVNTTQLRFSYEVGIPELDIDGYTTPVELKGDKGDPGGLNWAGAWNDSDTYEVDDIVLHNSVNYVSIQVSIDVEPGVDSGWESYWEIFSSPFVSGTMAGVQSTFVEGTLNGSRHLVYAHGLGARPVHVTILNDSFEPVGPEMVQTDTNNIDVDFSGWPTITGTWTILVSGITP